MIYKLSIPISYDKMGPDENVKELIKLIAKEFLNEDVIINEWRPVPPTIGHPIMLDINAKNINNLYQTNRLTERIIQRALELSEEIL